MELLERESFLSKLGGFLQEASGGRGRLAFVAGEAGVGKSVLVEAFSKSARDSARMLRGSCDPLSTPRPLGPLVDIASQVGGEFERLLRSGGQQHEVFSAFLALLTHRRPPSLAVFEDVHCPAEGGDELDELRDAIAPFQDIDAAREAGWVLVDGLDHCFNNPGVGGMGIHYINTDMLDTTLDPLMPEAMVYQYDAGGNLSLGAVEWIVPAEAWDAEGHGELPSVMGRHLHLNEALVVYVLHAWLFTENPAGAFEDWNPDVIECELVASHH